MTLLRKFVGGIVLISAVAFCPAASGQATKGEIAYSLRWKPKLGEVHHYGVHVKFEYASDGLVEFASELRVKVISVRDDGGYVVQTTTTGATVASGSEVRDLPAQPPETQAYTRSGLPTGASLEARDPDPFSDLLNHLTDFQSPPSPVTLRSSWINKAIGPKGGLFGQPRLTYTLVDAFHDGARHLLKVRYVAAIGIESEAASGTLVFDRSNNYLSLVAATIPHFRPEGAKEEASVSVEVKEKSGD